MPSGPISGPSVWRGKDLARRPDEWIRTFENWPEPERHRHLLRLWLAPKSARPLPEVFAPRHGSVVPGERGGIVVRGTTRTVVLEAE